MVDLRCIVQQNFAPIKVEDNKGEKDKKVKTISVGQGSKNKVHAYVSEQPEECYAVILSQVQAG